MPVKAGRDGSDVPRTKRRDERAMLFARLLSRQLGRVLRMVDLETDGVLFRGVTQD